MAWGGVGAGLAPCVLLLGVTLALCGFRLPLLEQDGVSAVFVSDDARVDYAKPLIGTLEVTARAQDE
ncbi:hypothetical protein VPJ68_07365, partial [Parabacteroides distasonis]